MDPMAFSMPVPHVPHVSHVPQVKRPFLAGGRLRHGWRLGLLLGLLVPVVALGAALALLLARQSAAPWPPSPTSRYTGPGQQSRTDGPTRQQPVGGLIQPAGTDTGALAPGPADEAGSRRDAQASYRLCGTADTQAAQAIGQLIAGRSFSARLVGRDDGCADLTISVAPADAAPGTTGTTNGPPASSAATTRQSTRLAVSVPARSGSKTITVAIVSENGTTHVTLGSGS